MFFFFQLDENDDQILEGAVEDIEDFNELLDQFINERKSESN